MVPEIPPRRSKSKREPTTIDLEARPLADETSPSAGDPVSPDPDITRPAETATGDATAETPAETTLGPETPTDAVPQSTPEPTAIGAEPATVPTEAEAAAAAETREAPDRPTERPQRPASPEPAPQAARGTTSGALAAGILGGLITLAGFGVLQYGGVIPSLGPATQNDGAALEGITGEIAALRGEIANRPAPDLSGIEQRLAAIESAAGEANRPDPDVEALQTAVKALTDQLSLLQGNVETLKQETTKAAADLTTRLGEAERRLDEPASDVQLARAIAVSALKTAIDRGGPFLAELDALKSVSPEDPAVAGLQPLASQGVAPRKDLVADFPATATAMIDAVRERAPDEGIVSRLINSAATAIRVRPVGTVEGTGPEAMIARIEDRIVNGDLKGAVLEWEALPDKAKAAGAAFKSRLDQRIAAETLVDGAVAGALTASNPANPG
ncbi:COG4223 family protein [Ensifer soli]|uniref:COG4223 family protein n=1 Tax=Ciceribacter sp. sgz301302 TaxID=3342379 RepID=UPI0035B77CB7